MRPGRVWQSTPSISASRPAGGQASGGRAEGRGRGQEIEEEGTHDQEEGRKAGKGSGEEGRKYEEDGRKAGKESKKSEGEGKKAREVAH